MDQNMSGLEPTLSPGFRVTLTMRRDAAPFRVYTGTIVAVDAQGLRLTCVESEHGPTGSCDVYIARDQIKSALVATPEHTSDDFGEEALAWEQRILAKPPLVGGAKE